ncbi:MAG: sulfotransferase [Deltaproteobacteria bacterium]|nr:sulfotransferase [Deltaproteobacteria bacterium]
MLFVGNGRSGTELTGNLLNAHPEMLLTGGSGVRVHELLHESFEAVLGRIIETRERFDQNPVSWGINYRVPVPPAPADSKLRVIGDKSAPFTAEALDNDSALLQRIREWCPLPLRFIHCVRNPYDCIGAKVKRSGESFGTKMEKTFRYERAAAETQRLVGEILHRSYLEDLIASPHAALRGLYGHLGLEAGEEHLNACASILYEAPEQSRFQVQWPAWAVAEVERRARALPHLHRYLDEDGRLPFGAPA